MTLNEWLRTAIRLQKRLPVEAFRSTINADDGWLIPVPRDITVIARDVRRLPTRDRLVVNQYKYILIINLAGNGSICMDGQKWRLMPGDVMLVFPHQAHCFADLEEKQLRWVLIGFCLKRSELALRHLRNHPLPAPPPVRRAFVPFLTAINACSSRNISNNHEIAARLWIMLLDMAAAGMHPPLAANIDANAFGASGKIIELLDVYIVEHLHEKIRMRDLSQHMHISPTCLRQRFHKAMGVSLGRYIRSRRLRLALDRKHRTDDSWSQIASQFGFTSLYSFSRAFKQEFRLSPRAYSRVLSHR